MPSVREFFLTEAGEYIDRLDSLVQDAAESRLDAKELLRLARGLRGSAQMAREEAVRQVAQILESAARAVIAGTLEWTGDIDARTRQTLSDLRQLVEAAESTDLAAQRVMRALNRWDQVRIRPPAGSVALAAAPPAAASPEPVFAEGFIPEAPPEEVEPPIDRTAAMEFRAYAARETAAIVAVLAAGIPALARNPLDRDPLKSILRRQRALLGAAQLESLPIIAEALRAVDAVTRRIAGLKLGVEGDWLALYQAAHDVLALGVSALERGDTPPPSGPALDRLRQLHERLVPQRPDEQMAAPPIPPREELPAEVANYFRTEATTILDRIERMAGELPRAAAAQQALLTAELSTALGALHDTARTFGFGRAAELAETALGHVADGHAPAVLELVPQLRAAATDDQSEPDVVPIESLLYRGDAALERALQLRSLIESAIRDDATAAEAIDELFDLLRLADA